MLDILSSYARVIKQRVYKLVTGIQNNNTGTDDLDKKEDGLKLNLEWGIARYAREQNKKQW